MKPEDLYLEVGFLVGVTGLAMIWPPLAFLGAALFFGAFAVVWSLRKAADADDTDPDAPVTGQEV